MVWEIMPLFRFLARAHSMIIKPVQSASQRSDLGASQVSARNSTWPGLNEGGSSPEASSSLGVFPISFFLSPSKVMPGRSPPSVTKEHVAEGEGSKPVGTDPSKTSVSPVTLAQKFLDLMGQSQCFLPLPRRVIHEPLKQVNGFELPESPASNP